MRVLKRLLLIVSSSIVLVIAFEVFVGLITIITFFSNPSLKSNVEKRGYEYQLFQYNPVTNKSVRGFATVGKELEGDFVTFLDNDKLIMLSKFGAIEYLCSGSCFCEDVKGTKRSASLPAIISRGLVYLVAGASSFVAVEKAKEYFEEKCVAEMSDSCPLSSIASAVDVCKQMKEEEFYLSDEDEMYKDNDEEDDEDENVIKIRHEDAWDQFYNFNFWCKGFCKESKLTNEQRKMIDFVIESFGFDDLVEFSKDYCTGRVDDWRKLELPIQFDEKDADYKFKEVSFAKKRFRFEFLDPFCSAMGAFDKRLYLKYFDEVDANSLDGLCTGDHTSIKCKNFDPDKMS